MVDSMKEMVQMGNNKITMLKSGETCRKMFQIWYVCNFMKLIALQKLAESCGNLQNSNLHRYALIYKKLQKLAACSGRVPPIKKRVGTLYHFWGSHSALFTMVNRNLSMKQKTCGIIHPKWYICKYLKFCTLQELAETCRTQICTDTP